MLDCIHKGSYHLAHDVSSKQTIKVFLQCSWDAQITLQLSFSQPQIQPSLLQKQTNKQKSNCQTLLAFHCSHCRQPSDTHCQGRCLLQDFLLFTVRPCWPCSLLAEELSSCVSLCTSDTSGTKLWTLLSQIMDSILIYRGKRKGEIQKHEEQGQVRATNRITKGSGGTVP